MNWGRNCLLCAVNLGGPFKLLNFPVQKLPHPPPCVTLFTAAGSCICSLLTALGTAWDLAVYDSTAKAQNRLSKEAMVVGNISFWVAEFLGRAFCLPTFLLCKEAMESCFWRLADTVRNWQADDFWFDVRSILLTQAIFYSLEWVCEPFRQSLPTANEQTGKANSLLTIPLQTSAVQLLTWVLSEQEESEFQQTSASWQLRTFSLAWVSCLAGIQQEWTVVSVAAWHIQKK